MRCRRHSWISGARFGQPFEASRDIHTIAENVIVVDHVVILVDAEENSMRRLAETAVFCPVVPYWTATATHRVNDASKLEQEAVAGYSLSGRVRLVIGSTTLRNRA